MKTKLFWRTCIVLAMVLGTAAPVYAEPNTEQTVPILQVEPVQGEFQFSGLRIINQIWNKADGDWFMETGVRNASLQQMDSITWKFMNLSEDKYSEIYAWDEEGYLDLNTSYQPDEATLLISVKFRKPIEYGENSHFKMTVSIKDIAQLSDDNSHLTWNFLPKAVSWGLQVFIPLPANTKMFDVVSSWPFTEMEPGGAYYEAPNPETENLVITPDISYAATWYADITNYKQTDIRWNDLSYSGMTLPDNPISSWGSFITTASVAINVEAQEQNIQFQSSPDKLNRWLLENGGYLDNIPIPEKIAEYARWNGVAFYLNAQFGEDFARAEQHYELSDQVILGVNPVPCPGNAAHRCPSHYVLVEPGGGGSTDNFYVYDPMQGMNFDLKGYYEGTFVNAMSFSATPPVSTDSLQLWMTSKPDITVNDGEGRRTGHNPDGPDWAEIPDTYYGFFNITDRYLERDWEPTRYISGVEISMPGAKTGDYGAIVHPVGMLDSGEPYSLYALDFNNEIGYGLDKVTGMSSEYGSTSYTVRHAIDSAKFIDPFLHIYLPLISQ